jgi:hypothetical protein
MLTCYISGKVDMSKLLGTQVFPTIDETISIRELGRCW